MHTLSHAMWGLSKHVAFGYLIYSLVQHSRGRSPTGWTVSVLLVGIVFPDLVDKPLAFAGVVEYGRSFGHSLITALALLVAVGRLTRRWNRVDLGTAFAVGYLSHIAVDLYGPMLTGNDSMDTAFLFWPVAVEQSLGVPTPELPVSRYGVFVVVVVASLCLWVYDRMPPISGAVRFSCSRLGVRGPNDP